MRLDSITLHEVALTRSDGGTGEALIVQASHEEHHGWSEIAIGRTPWHGTEFFDSAWLFASTYAIPELIERPPVHPSGTGIRLERLRGHPRTRMALELALWDLYSRTHALPMLDALGGGHQNLTFSAKLKIQDTLQDLEKLADSALNRGASVLHVAIRPGWDIDPLAALRSRFPLVRIVADAHGSFDPSESRILASLDQYGIECLLEPFSPDDTTATTLLAKNADSNIWVRVRNERDLANAPHAHVAGLLIDGDAFGGFRPLLDVATFCLEHGLLGALAPSGATVLSAGHTALLAAATGLDVGPLAHYFGQWGRDIVKPGWKPGKLGLDLPTGSGTGLTVDRPYLQRQTRRTEVITA
ncbi:MAG: hypothetical protein HKO76_09290 [Acidimicrobiia bacterium]|nr:hypothetical protein [Acidimicrobiia bacterium]